MISKASRIVSCNQISSLWVYGGGTYLVLCDSLGSLDQSTPLGSGWLVAASESREKRHRWAPGAISQKTR